MNATVLLVGGSGFIGRHLAQRLVSRGLRVRVVSRDAARGAAPSVEVERTSASIEDRAAMVRALEGAWAVVNLVGTTSAATERAFYALHCDAPAHLALAARRTGATRFIHVSAMGIGLDAPSAADRSKAAGEQAVREAYPDAIFARPALAYGPGDHFFTRFAPLAQRAPAIPLIGGGHTRFQPMHVEDLVEAMARLLEYPGTAGRTYELGGGEVYSFRELIERLCRALGRQPWLAPIPYAVAEAGARLTQWLPRAPLTLDQVRLLRTDKVMSDPQRAPHTLELTPRPLEPFLSELARQYRR